MRKLLVATMSVAAVSVGGFAFSPVAGAQGEEECQSIVEIASTNPDFETLTAAVTAAGLVETLEGDGPFTVFAPTDAAFDALPEGTLDSLLADPTGALTDILTLHVIAGAVDSEAAIAAAGTNVETLGGPVAVALEGENLTVGGATVVTPDIEACNGIIHVIDSVITEAAEVPQETTTTTVPPAVDDNNAENMPMPTRVDTGDSGIAASAGVNVALVSLLAGLSALGLGSSAFALARSRRED